MARTSTEIVSKSVKSAVMLVIASATVSCAVPLSAMRGVVDRNEEIWIEIGHNDAGLWAMDVSSMALRIPSFEEKSR